MADRRQHGQTVLRPGFAALLAEVKGRIQSAKTQAVMAVNSELVRLCWDIGRIIEERRRREGWGAAAIPQLAHALHNELPELKGFSERNIKRMLAFYREYPTEIVQDPLEQLPSPEKAPQPVAQIRSAQKAPQPVAQLPDSLLWSVPWAHHSTPIPACLWFHARDRRGHVLFIDARKLGRMVDRTHRELTDEDISRTANTYHAWRGERDAGDYAEVPGFCKSAPLEEIREHGHVLTPCRCVAAEAQEDDGEPFEEKMKRLTSQLIEQMTEGRKQDKVIEKDLKGLGFWEKGE